MLVLLIQPEYKDSWAAPPLGLGYIASALRNKGHKVELLDLTLRPLEKHAFKSIVQAINPDMIGISLMVKALPEVKKIISYIKSIKDFPVVIGGPQVTIEPEFTKDYTGADFAVIGEGENFLDNLTPFTRNAEVKHLDNLAFPAWDLIEPLKYNISPVLTPVKKMPVAPILTTRGCPYKCSFCGGPLVWKSFRRRSATNIISEIELLRDKHNVKEFFISDDNFTLSKRHAIDLCRALIEKRINMPWACPNGIRIDTADKELLGWMKKAGCYLVGFGIESGNQEILDKAHKELDLNRVKEAVNTAKSVGLMTYGFFIIGLPGETPKTIRQTIDFAKSLKLDRAYFNILLPFPGTEVFKLYSQKKKDIDWANLDSGTGMIAEGIDYDGLTGQDLVDWQRRALREFYFRPRIIWSVLRNLRISGIKTALNTSFVKRLLC
jgi:radical SAM superfamily enzyme YgiQ (UPF0313 family)